MTTKSKTIWVLGGLFLSAVVLFASPAPSFGKSKASPKEAAKAAEQVIKARQKAIESAERARRKTAQAQAEAWKKAAVAAAKARTESAKAVERAARATATARRNVGGRAPAGGGVIVSGGRGPAGGGGLISVGHADGKTRISVGVGLGGLFGGGAQRQWVPGRYEVRLEQVCVEPAHYEWQVQRVEIEPAHYETRYLPPVEEVLYDSRGNAHRIVVRPGRTEKVYVPAQYTTRKVQVWVPDRCETREVRVWVPGHWVWVPAAPRGGSGLNLRAVFNF